MVKNIIKRALICVVIGLSSITHSKTTGDINDPKVAEDIANLLSQPSVAASKIMIDILGSLKQLSLANKYSLHNVESVIRIKLLPSLNTEYATKMSLKENWKNLTQPQKNIFKKYIEESLIADYVSMLSSYTKINSVTIDLDPKEKIKGKRALIRMRVKINEDSNNFFLVSLKLIKEDDWKVYDVSFKGVSIIKSYRAQFSSYIKRKGLPRLIDKIEKKLNKISK